ncbi:hypothetical protein [Megasphaera elsdenii]|uniref:Uncharacterized protein n=1 Tax=Megasphaera elsdenii TaxID=907 RepID=A0A848ESB5_MEGEL|nr:hypothetical protein [Megasphaera elsdenii]NMK39891.1 hypothetical protein [Megasphaera elsdenii]
MDDIDSLCAGVYYGIHDIARHDFQVRRWTHEELVQARSGSDNSRKP